ALLDEGEIGAVLRLRNRDAAVTQGLVIPRMERDGRFDAEDDRATAKRRDIVGLIGDRCDTDRRGLLGKESIKISRVALHVGSTRKKKKKEGKKKNQEKKNGHDPRGKTERARRTPSKK